MSIFDSIFGQEHAIETLSRAMVSNRLPHGLVFAGPSGVGKFTTAKLLAKWFLCPNATGTIACNTCRSCVAVNANAHPDLHHVYRQLVNAGVPAKEQKAARDISVKLIRDHVIEPASKSSVLGVGKVFVVEEADSMQASAGNSLLKTLEEPSGRTLIVLLTDQPTALLQTIRSRTQAVRFGPLDEGIVKSELENRGHDARTSAIAARISEGSLGVAIRWIDDGVVTGAMELAGQLEGILACKPAGDLPDWLKKSAEAFAKRQSERGLSTSEDQSKREGLLIYLKLSGQLLRTRMRQTSESAQLEQLCAAIDSIAQAEAFVDSNVGIVLVIADWVGQLERRFAST